MNFLQAYREAFHACYPNTQLGIRRNRGTDTPTWWISIDGNKGDYSLSEDAIREATRNLTRGKLK